ncbi:MAG: mechanosensitive ion channel family protein [Thermodesulfobacteriota bacterium]
MDFSLHTLLGWLSDMGLRLIAAALIFFCGKWLARRLTDLMATVLHRHHTDVTLVNFLHHISYYGLLVAVVIAALSKLGINTASFLTVIGAAGLAVGLALKDSLGHFAAGVLLILFRPFKVGDAVTAGGVSGTVKAISIFNTELTTPDNQKVLVPNSSIMSGVITNATANPTRRIDLIISIAYQDEVERARRILSRIIGEDSRVLADPAPTIEVLDLGANSVNLAVRPWVATTDYWATRCNLIEKIKAGFEQEGISIPFPQQDVHLFVRKPDEPTRGFFA